MKLPDDDALKPVDVIRHLVPAGTVTVVATAGGGGWGDPLRRDPERVRRDVVEGYVSLDAAKRDYGVVLDPRTLEVNVEATYERRS
jgi:N-methylhydantoinase B/oxoprolinase/acetone carboxylase alpha subunit